MSIRMIVGLGNPGAEYENTRHNAGFCVLDALGGDFKLSYWKNELGALAAHKSCDAGELIFVKPQAYMNNSGGPVNKLARAYKIRAAEILVIHDDMDILPAHIRIKLGGGAAGHNGLKSLNDKLQSTHYPRVRVGIGHPKNSADTTAYVLSMPRGKDKDAFEHAIELARQAVHCILEEGEYRAMERFNTHKTPET